MQTESKANSPTALWSTLMARLVAYHPTLNNLSDIRRAQLLMVFSLIIEVVCLISSVGALLSRGKLDSVSMMLFSVGLLCLLVYGIGRTQYYKWGAWLLITGVAGAGYLLFFWSTSRSPIVDLFIMLPMALTLAAGLLSVREQITFLLLNVVLVAVLPFFATPETIASHYAGIFLSLGILLVIVSAFRSRLEHDQLLELNRANEELRTMQDSLEDLILLGTKAADAARAETVTALQALQGQTWFLNAQVVLAEALRGEQDLTGLAKRTMQALCTQLDAPVGAFFLLTDGQLEFLGGFAFLPGAQSPLRFQLGEGLVGQAAMERQKIFLEDIPTGYFDVISGLGSAVPSQLAILPCIYNQQLIGVIEIGLLHDLSHEQAQFFDTALENIAIAFQTALARLRISELLSETQTQTEELQSREEELRAINEELEAQTDSLRQASNRTS